ncbi:MAG: BTAD domain-containing putative transcriptional regulator [Proteocatella sp.]
MDILNIKLIGDINITFGEEDLFSRLSSKSIAIIAILMCNDNHKISREKLASMLWADSFETANYNLRYNLWNIKKAVPKDSQGEIFILSTKEHCHINPRYRLSCDLVKFDCLEIEDKTAEDITFINRLIYAKRNFRGDFLDEFYIKDSDDFNEWILFQRAKYQKKYIQVLNALLDYYIKNEIYADATEILEHILSVNPYEEEAYYKLMKLYIDKDERHMAIAQYKKCYDILRQELNISPQKKIKELYLTLVDDETEKADIKQKEDVVIKINEYADSSCEYILMSELAERLLEISRKSNISGVCRRYWMDISEIQPRALDYIDLDYKITTIKDIRLYYSLKSILDYLANERNIQLLIANRDKIDLKSRQFLGIIESSRIVNMKYIENNSYMNKNEV